MSNVTEKTLQTKKGDFSTTPSKNVTFAYRFRLFPMQKYNRKSKQPNNYEFLTIRLFQCRLAYKSNPMEFCLSLQTNDSIEEFYSVDFLRRLRLP